MKSAVLIVIGVVLIGVAVVMNNNASERERVEQRINDLLSDVERETTGPGERKMADKQDRMPVYLVGGLGGVAILAGIATLGTGKK